MNELEKFKQQIHNDIIEDAADLLKKEIRDWGNHDIIRLKLWLSSQNRNLKEIIWDGSLSETSR